MEAVSSLWTDVKLLACIQHWRDGVPWEETGVYEHLLQRIAENEGKFDGCSNLGDVVERYRRLDELFASIRHEGRLRPRHEVSPGTFRESQGIGIHIDRNGGLVFSHRGTHRLAAALVLDLKVIPAQVGVVHRAAIKKWRRELLAEPFG